MVMKDGSVTIF